MLFFPMRLVSVFEKWAKISTTLAILKKDIWVKITSWAVITKYMRAYSLCSVAALS